MFGNDASTNFTITIPDVTLGNPGNQTTVEEASVSMNGAGTDSAA